MVDKLLNTKVILKLSDPWDLGEQLDWRALEAVIVNVKYEEDVPTSLAIKLSNPFNYHDTHCEFFIALPRLEGADFIQLVDHRAIFCALTRVTPEQMADDDPFNLSQWRGGLGIIGELEISW
ncbi:MAG: hypothetical protein ACYC1B_06985 [Thermoleophilia bacterium]